MSERYLLRPAEMADLGDALAVRVAAERVDGEDHPATADQLEREWLARGERLGAYTWMVSIPEGRAVGYGALLEAGGEVSAVALWVTPEHRGHGVERMLLAMAETQALDQAQHGSGAGARLFVQSLNRNMALQAAIDEAGFVRSSSFDKMELRLDGAAPAPAPTGSIALRPFDAERDELAVYAADEEAFLDERGKTPRSYAQWRRRFGMDDGYDPTLWCVAWDGDEVAGAALNAVEGQAGRVHHLGVRRPWRRQGVGMALLQWSLVAFGARNLTAARLNVDAESPTNAQVLYARAGFQTVDAYHNYSKVLHVESA